MADELWFSEQVAEVCDYTPATVLANASESRRKKQAGQPLGPGDLPLPLDWVKRKVLTRGGYTRTVVSPRWRASEVQAFVRARPPARGRGGGRRPETSRDVA